MSVSDKLIEESLTNYKNENRSNERDISNIIFVMSSYIEPLIKNRFNEYKVEFFYNYKKAIEYLKKEYKDNNLQNVKLLIIDEELIPEILKSKEENKNLEELVSFSEQNGIAVILLNPYLKVNYNNKKLKVEDELFDNKNVFEELLEKKKTRIYFFNLLESIESIKKYLKYVCDENNFSK
ncbi:MAG: hypothetical protein QXU20_00185 [Candidatus Woesearchaeota archaeon]